MSRLSKQHFWAWFNRNQQEYFDLPKKPQKEVRYWLNEMNAHLRAYFKFLRYSMFWENKQVTTLYITVFGKAAHFKKVQALVALAPEIPGWKIHALEDPMPEFLAMTTQSEDAVIDSAELFFSIDYDRSECAHITAYHPLCTEENEWFFRELAKNALYFTLGEYSFGMDVRSIKVANLSSVETEDVFKIEELVEHIGARKSSVVVDDRGRLMGDR